MYPKSLSETLTIQFRYTNGTFPANLKDLTDEDGLKQPGADGNCLNWVAGHIVKHRLVILRLLGQDLPVDESKYERYDRLTEPVTNAEGTVPLTEIVEDFSSTRDALDQGLSRMAPEAMEKPAAFSPTNNPNETIGTLLAGLLFHESYHIGQLGVLRRLAGSEGAIR